MKYFFIALSFFIFWFSTQSLAEGSDNVAFLVICDNETVLKQVSKALDIRLKKANFQVSERLPKAKLIVYAQQDVNDRVNDKGWSFAAAHVTNRSTYYLAAKLLKSDSAEVKAIEPAIMDMLKSDGFLTYLNVAHVDKLDEGTISIIADNFVGEFAKRVKE